MTERIGYPQELVKCEALGSQLRTVVEEEHGPIGDVKFHIVYGSMDTLQVDPQERAIIKSALDQISAGASIVDGVNAGDFYGAFDSRKLKKKWKARTTTLAVMKGLLAPQAI